MIYHKQIIVLKIATQLFYISYKFINIKIYNIMKTSIVNNIQYVIKNGCLIIQGYY